MGTFGDQVPFREFPGNTVSKYSHTSLGGHSGANHGVGKFQPSSLMRWRWYTRETPPSGSAVVSSLGKNVTGTSLEPLAPPRSVTEEALTTLAPW